MLGALTIAGALLVLYVLVRIGHEMWSEGEGGSSGSSEQTVEGANAQELDRDPNIRGKAGKLSFRMGDQVVLDQKGGNAWIAKALNMGLSGTGDTPEEALEGLEEAGKEEGVL